MDRANSSGVHFPNTPNPNPQCTASGSPTASSPVRHALLPAYLLEASGRRVQFDHRSARAASCPVAPDRNTTRDWGRYCGIPNPNSATTDHSNSNFPIRGTHSATTSSPPSPTDPTVAWDRPPNHRACTPTHRAPNPTLHPAPSSGVAPRPNTRAGYQSPKCFGHCTGTATICALDRAKSL